MDASHSFRLDRTGVRELLNSPGFRDAVQATEEHVDRMTSLSH
jgi:hypothetical protein